MIRNGRRLIAMGVAIGVGARLALSRPIEAQLWGVSAHDPLTFAAAVALLLATGVDPLVAVRHE